MSFSSNPPNGKTGAPGDGLCTDCHNTGAPLQNIMTIENLPNNVIAGTQYNLKVRILNLNGNSTRAGFQAVILDDTNKNNFGDISVASTNPTATVSGAREYVEHNPAQNFNGAADVSWDFVWTAPSGPIGQTATIYAAGIIDFSNIMQESFTTTLNAAVPIELASFTAKEDRNNVTLEWVTLTETNNDYFTIERSSNGSDWKEIVNIQGNNLSHEMLTYRTEDNRPLPGSSYYKLKQTDLDGAFTYSDIITVERNSTDTGVLIFPNPATSAITIKSETNTIDNVEIFNMLGQNVLPSTSLLSSASNSKTIDVQNLPTGNYNVIVDSKAYMINKQ